jgi:hypothetical protein
MAAWLPTICAPIPNFLADYTGAIDPEGFSLASYAAPWVSAVLNENLNFHASGKLVYGYAENVEPLRCFLFELEQTELKWRAAPLFSITLGRQRFQDALGIAVSGLFGGAGGSVLLGTGRLSPGAFYTGSYTKKAPRSFGQAAGPAIR